MAHETTDVLIVGGGIMGMSVAHQIARRSSLSVIVLEKGSGLGEGSTGGSSAITRQRYSTLDSIRVARDGNTIFRNWREYVQLDAPVGKNHDIGVLWMMDSEAEAVDADRDRMVAEGIDAVSIDAAESKRLFPGLSMCMTPFDLSGEIDHVCEDGDRFLLERDAGFFDATGALLDVRDAAVARGIDVRMQTEVVDVRTDGDRVVGVTLADGSTIDAGVVVNAAGPWCNRVSEMAGLETKWTLDPTRIQVIYRDLPASVPGPIPVVGDAAGGIYFRPEASGGQIIVGSILEEDEQEIADPDNYNMAADRSWIDLKIHALHHRIPSLPYSGVPGGMASLYTINRQDVMPILGPTAIEGFAVMNGFSGHGFKESQVVAGMMAKWITGEAAPFDTSVPMDYLSASRDPVEIEDHTVLA
ncbi:MAG: NAD(P)/FAD-dependent oxidoreductase [Acidimicrobiia bacterium]